MVTPFIVIRSEDGGTLYLNRYFLQLYNKLYFNLLSDHETEDISITFTATALSDLINFKEVVEKQHLNCDSKNEEKAIEEEIENKIIENKIIENSLIENEILESKCDKGSSPDTKEETDVKNNQVEVNEELPLNDLSKCPLKCNNQNDLDTPDKMFAHITTNHFEETIQISIQRFVKRLSNVISGKCVYECEYQENESRNITRDFMFSRLRDHYRRVHLEEDTHCIECGKTFKNRFKLHVHVTRIHSSDVQNCELCPGRTFSSLHNLKRHKSQVHLKAGKEVPCEKCGKVFYSKTNLKKHILTVHEGLKQYVCDKCGTKMSKFSNLSDHRLKVHGKKFPSSYFYYDLIKNGQHPFTNEMPQKLIT